MSKRTNSTKSTKATKKTASDPDLVPLSEAMKKPGKAKGNRQTAKAKPPKSAKEKKLSCLDAAARVLKDAGSPMNCPSMIAAMKEKGLWSSDAPTPHATLYSAILREITTKKDAARFKKVDRGQFEFAG